MFVRRGEMAAAPHELRVYGRIGSDVTAAGVRDVLAAAGDGPVSVRINSPGGDVFEGLAILAALRGHAGPVTTIVDGLAASAASFILQGGRERLICDGAEVMVHDAWSAGRGNAAGLRDLAARLERVTGTIADVYAGRSGRSRSVWLAAMGRETWFSAAEAVAAGLADRVSGGAAGSIAAELVDGAFMFQGRAWAPAPVLAGRDGGVLISAAAARGRRRRRGAAAAAGGLSSTNKPSEGTS